MESSWDKSPRVLVQEIASLTQSLLEKQRALQHKQENCSHDWSKPVYDPIVSGGYEHPGDPVGTMGVDWRGPVYVPRSEKPRWKRECSKCLLREETQRSQDDVRKVPVF
jgi:hypothetical protein